MRKVHLLAATAVAAGGAAAIAIAAPLSIGPSTTIAPYVLPKAPGVSVTSILTVGDGAAGNGYRMVGIPDGLGAYGDKAEEKKSVVVLMNHELGAGSGLARAHGQKGAFVSRWVIDGKTLEVKSGKDLIQPGVKYYNYANGLYDGSASAFARFCSGSLTDEGQFFAKGAGTKERIYFANEENGNGGRLFGVSMDGQAQQLPRLGLFSWENTLAAYNKSETTLVHGDEDGNPGELWVYVGKKTNTGNVFDRAGLTNGKNYVLKISDAVNTDAKFRAAYNKGDKVPFTLTEVDWNNASGDAQNAEAVADGGLGFNRMEDGAWDPKNRNVFYFLTTDGGEGIGNAGKGGGLWRVTYKDIENPAAGRHTGAPARRCGEDRHGAPGAEQARQHGHRQAWQHPDPGGSRLTESSSRAARASISPASSPIGSRTALWVSSRSSTRRCSSRRPGAPSSPRTRSRAASSRPTISSGSARGSSTRRCMQHRSIRSSSSPGSCCCSR